MTLTLDELVCGKRAEMHVVLPEGYIHGLSFSPYRPREGEGVRCGRREQEWGGKGRSPQSVWEAGASGHAESVRRPPGGTEGL